MKVLCFYNNIVLVFFNYQHSTFTLVSLFAVVTSRTASITLKGSKGLEVGVCCFLCQGGVRTRLFSQSVITTASALSPYGQYCTAF
jgi:hypothetical protein